MPYYTTLEYYAAKYQKEGRKFAYRAETGEEYREWKAALRKRLVEITGMNLCQIADPALRLESSELDEGRLCEYCTIQTEPGIRMPFWLYRPERHTGGVMLIPHGHGGGKETVRRGQWDFIKGLLDRGYLVICPDERGSGDRREYWAQGDTPDKTKLNTHRELTQIALGFGQCILGLALWDLTRLLDAVSVMPEVDPEQIWCAGMSGGGQQTLWLTAIDDRIRGAFISGYFYGMLESLVRLPMNCACNFVPHIWETADMGDLAALIAPRPLFIESGEQDNLNGAPGLDNVYPQVGIAKRAYELFGAEECLVHKIHPGGHVWVGDGMLGFLDKRNGIYG